MSQISIDNVIAQALEGAQVAKPDLNPFRANLELLIDAINAEADVHPAAVPRIESHLAEPLRNRLEVSDWVRRFPEIHQERIESPLFLTGLPRSGTTYFQYLFDPEPSMRMLRYWEGKRPCPPPGFAPDTVEARIKECAEEKAQSKSDELSAKIAQIHLSDADGPEECFKILDQTFIDLGKCFSFRIPTYFERCLSAADMKAVYEHHKLVLQLLQWRGQHRRWVLKWPCHLVALEDILTVYPDAKFIVTHRDPMQALASNASLTEMLRRDSSQHVENVEIGQQMLEMLQIYLERLVAFDDAHGDRIAHVHYQVAVEQPELAVAQALEKLGMKMEPSFTEAIIAWRRDNPPGKRGTHSYALENYGLDVKEVAKQFAFYIDRFSIPTSKAAAA